MPAAVAGVAAPGGVFVAGFRVDPILLDELESLVIEAAVAATGRLRVVAVDQEFLRERDERMA